MGNFLRAPPQPNIPFQPNIPLNLENQNDLNRPHSVQMRDMVLNFGMPFFYIAAAAIQELRSSKQRDMIQQQATNIEDLNHQLILVKNELQESSTRIAMSKSLLSSLKAIEEDEEMKYRENLKRLKHYEEGLETILDIRCSYFKYKDERLTIEDDLVNRLSEDNLGYVVKYTQLREIYNHDHLFCGRERKDNGKLRQLYVQQWKHKLEMTKYQNIVSRMTSASCEDS